MEIFFFFNNGLFSRWIWPNWGNTSWADMAGLGSIGLIIHQFLKDFYNM